MLSVCSPQGGCRRPSLTMCGNSQLLKLYRSPVTRLHRNLNSRSNQSHRIRCQPNMQSRTPLLLRLTVSITQHCRSHTRLVCLRIRMEASCCRRSNLRKNTNCQQLELPRSLVTHPDSFLSFPPNQSLRKTCRLHKPPHMQQLSC